MKKILSSLFILFVYFTSTMGQPRAISMTTANSAGTAFAFEIAAKVKDTRIDIDFGDGSLISHYIDTIPTAISGNLGLSQAVTIYGNDITYFLCIYNKLTTLDVSRDTALKALICSINQLSILDLKENLALVSLTCIGNQLTLLDVSKNTALSFLNCMHNQITELDLRNNTELLDFYCSLNLLTSLDVSKNLKLQLLDCGQNQLSNLDLNQNTALQTLYCYNNPLKSLDITQNTALQNLSCTYNQLTSLNLSQNLALQNIDCSHNQLSALNVNYNEALLELKCDFNQLTSVSTTYNSALEFLSCTDNLLTSIDITGSKELRGLYCYYNQLQNIDVSQNTALQYFLCNNNRIANLNLSSNTLLEQLWFHNNVFTFATLPVKKAGWETYTYTPQKAIPISKSLNTGVELDLSSQLTVNGSTTAYKWKTQSNITLVQGSDYSLTNGKTTFLKPQADSVYCEMTNATFPDFSVEGLRTTYAQISSPTASEEVITSVLEIYVCSKTIYINSPENAHLSVFDVNGRLVKSKFVYKGVNSLQLSNIGIYFVKIAGNSGIVARKVIIE